MSLESFDPNGVGLHNGNFIGLPFSEEEAALVLFPVPWDVTVSSGAGTSSGPKNILRCSAQLDLYDADAPGAWKKGIYYRPIPKDWFRKSKEWREKAEEYIEFLEEGGDPAKSDKMARICQKINAECAALHSWVEAETGALLDAGKVVGLVGGDHSTPLGYLQALAARHEDFGILHIDAHMDLREAYEGFSYSHASIFYNALQIPNISRLVQVGVRDYCDAEIELANSQPERVHVFSDLQLQESKLEGKAFAGLAEQILESLPRSVYISFDIDGLDPALCPHTGTPVPGGLQFAEAMYLIKKVASSGRRIIGFDLSETAGGAKEWDGNVAARVLYKLSLMALQSQEQSSAKPQRKASARARKQSA